METQLQAQMDTQLSYINTAVYWDIIVHDLLNAVNEFLLVNA
ncbi:hypothetical protein OROHE_013647 [Orobanche hederae]